MSRVAKVPVPIPSGVEVGVDGSALTVKGPKGMLRRELNAAVEIVREDGEVRCVARAGVARANAQAGTARALLNNMVRGVTEGFERRLQLVGVGYRAQAQGSTLNIALGYSHPIEYTVPDGITVETPSLTEIVVKGIDKQQVGQVAAVIRAFRPPEPYKGKGVKYANEVIVRKEAKKK